MWVIFVRVMIVRVMFVRVMVVMLMIVILQVGWERTDTYLVTAHSPDCVLRVWRTASGQLVTRLKVSSLL